MQRQHSNKTDLTSEKQRTKTPSRVKSTTEQTSLEGQPVHGNQRTLSLLQQDRAVTDHRNSNKQNIVQARAQTSSKAAMHSSSHIRSRLGTGQAIPSHISKKFSTAYQHNLTQVKVHPNSHVAAEAGAKALTTDKQVAFAPGEYKPDTPAGDELIAHELAHVVQQAGGNKNTTSTYGHSYYEHEADAAARTALSGSAAPTLSPVHQSAVQLREYGPLEDIDTSEMKPGDWRYTDRISNTTRWRSANLYNLLHAASHEYKQVAERTAFYWWYYNLMSSRGHDIRWPLAAAVVAGGADNLANRDPAGFDMMRSNSIESLARRGNQVIFDDVLPKLRDLYLRPTPLTGSAAQSWDEQILIEEQNLIQPLYSALTVDEISTFSDLAKQKGVLATGGSLLFGRVASGLNNIGGATPPFPDSLDIRVPEDRWRYGMMLAHYFSPGSAGDASASLAHAMSLTPPAPGTGYTDGSKLAEVDRFANLHQVTAMMTSNSLDVDALRTAIQALSADERAVFHNDPWHQAVLRHVHGMSAVQADALLNSEDLSGCTLFLVDGLIDGTAQVTPADNIIVSAKLGSGWTAHGGTRRVQVQAISAQAWRLFGSVGKRWVWEDVLRCYPPPTPTPVPVPPPVSASYTVYYETGNADLEEDSNSGNNFTTLNQLLGILENFKDDDATDRIELTIIGHASPRWKNANFTGSLRKNFNLSQARAQNTEDYIESAYAQYEGPVPIVVISQIVTASPLIVPVVADDTTTLGLGSAQGLLTTFDPDNDEQRFRRTDVYLRVTFKRP